MNLIHLRVPGFTSVVMIFALVLGSVALASADGVPPTLAWANRLDRTAQDHMHQLRVGADHIVTVNGLWRSDYADNIITVRYDAEGDELWHANLPLPFPYIGPGMWDETDLAVDDQGNAYVTGSLPDGDGTWFWMLMLTAKYDHAGKLKWIQNIPPVGAYAAGYGAVIAVAPDGGVVTGGGMDQNIKLPLYYAMTKYNSSGQGIWDHLYYKLSLPGTDPTTPSAMAIDSAGDIYLTGAANGVGEVTEFCTVKAASDGVRIWTDCLAGAGDQSAYGRAVVADSDENAYVVGSVNGVFTAVKYGVDGTVLSEHHDVEGEAVAAALSPSGNLVVTGTAAFDVGNTCATIVYHHGNEIVWQAFDRGPNQEPCTAADVALDAAGNVYVAGALETDRASSDIVVIKYSFAGERLWMVRYNGGVSGENSAARIATDGLSIYVAGSSAGDGAGMDFVTLKYDQDCDGCLIDLNCYADGQTNPQNACQYCDLDLAPNAWTMAADGVSCDDGLFCNGADQCAGGQCAAHAGDPCELPDTCSEEQDTCLSPDDDIVDDDAVDDDTSDDDSDDDAADDDSAGDDDDDDDSGFACGGC